MLSTVITLLFLLDRSLRMAAIEHFFRQADPPMLAAWPSISLIQPVTVGAGNLAGNLCARVRQEYAGQVQHLLVCDAQDRVSRAICEQVMADNSAADMTIVLIAQPTIASKIAKLNAGVAKATGEILCFIDDDIEPPVDALRRFVSYLAQPGVGAVFGLAQAVSWSNPWSSLLSLFVNSNALPSYIPLTYLSDPVAITGHFFALRAADLQQVGGWQGREQNIDDDNYLGRRLIAAGLRLQQTPVIYRVHNELGSWAEYAAQIKRWFILPRQSILPYLGRKQKLLAGLLSLGIILQILSLFGAIVSPSWQAWLNLLVVTLIFYGGLVWMGRYVVQAGCLRYAWLLPITVFVTPLQMLWALIFAKPVIQWRGQRLRVEQGGKFERVAK